MKDKKRSDEDAFAHILRETLMDRMNSVILRDLHTTGRKNDWKWEKTWCLIKNEKGGKW